MTTIVTRAGKGSPLTNNEVDTNFTNLNDAKIETLTSTDASVTITGTGSSRDLSVPVNPNVVSGPASSTDNAVARFDGTTGKLIQNSTAATIDDSGNADFLSQKADFFDIDTAATTSAAVGRLRWDASKGTAVLGEVGGNLEIAVGQTLDAYVTNAESVTINKGQPVYLFSATGNRASVKLAFNTSDATSAKTFGVAAENITAGGTGLVRCVGVLDGLNLGSYTAGDTLYLGATAGTLTATKPQAPNHLVYVGLVERANNGNGQLYVRVQNGYELDEIHDVQINSGTLANGQTILYDAATSLWKNANLTAGTGVAITNGASSVTIANTGVTQATAGTGISVSAGTGNVTITNTAPDQTVALTAGTGISTSGTYPNFTITNSGVTSISGTASQITASASTGSVTLSLPSTINVNTSGTASNVTGTVAIANGGTGATTEANARANLNVPTRTGGDASGTWGISITGNAATATSATSATTATTATNWGSYGAVPAAGTSFGNANTIGRSDGNGYTYFNYINSNTSNSENPTVSQVIVTNGGDNFYRKASIAHLTGSLSGTAPINITGSAGSATTASTANALNTGNSYTAAQYYVNGWFRNNANNTGLYNENTTQHWSSASNGYWDASSTTSVSGIRFYTGGHVSAIRGYLYTNTSNEIGFLNTAASWSLRVDNSGNTTATGTVTSNSDERLKTNWRPVQDNFVTKLANVKSGVYDRVDQEATQVGVSAQSLQTLLPEAVGSDSEGILNVAYGNAALVSAIELAKVVEELRAEVARLKAKLGE